MHLAVATVVPVALPRLLAGLPCSHIRGLENDHPSTTIARGKVVPGAVELHGADQVLCAFTNDEPDRCVQTSRQGKAQELQEQD